MRGKASGSWKCFCAMGITPACAGKRTQYFPACSCIWDHPRVCGEKSFGDVVALDAIGSPPRVRGKDSAAFRFLGGGRITPACAGKRKSPLISSVTRWDHPRVCGEKKDSTTGKAKFQGSPPRVRGKDPALQECDAGTRITPACAGKSYAKGTKAQLIGDHLRVCGEKFFTKGTVEFRLGSPPRVRGKDGHHLLTSCSGGITPACAGKRGQMLHELPFSRDHPRVCGEKSALSKNFTREEGSPPRVRGKVANFGNQTTVRGITPACAGKSPQVRHRQPDYRDHPRVCGEKFLIFC